MTLSKEITTIFDEVINPLGLLPQEISTIIISANNIVIKSHDYAWMFFLYKHFTSFYPINYFYNHLY